MAGTLLLGSSAKAQNRPASGDLIINEVLYDPPAGNDPGEYVELLNRSERTFDLSDFTLADSRGEPVPVISESYVLAPGDYAVLVQEGKAFQDVFPDVDAIEPGSWPQMNNGGDRVQLLFGDTVVDAVPYEPGWGGEDVALERIDPAGPSDEAGNFGSSTAEIGTPGKENTLADGGGDTTPPVLASVAATTHRTELAAVFSEELVPASVHAGAFGLEAGDGGAPAVVQAHVHGDDPARAVLALSDTIESGAYTLSASEVRDAAGNEQEETRLSFKVARRPEPGAIVINELWYGPEPSALEFVELYNRSDQAFDLSAFHLADDRREGSVIASREILLPAGGYAVLVRDSAAFGRRFPEVDGIPVAPWPALNNGGDTAALFFGETLVDSVPYAPSWGGSATASLARIDPAGPSASPTNFGTSTAPGGGTPGRQNAIYARDTTSPLPVFARVVRDAPKALAVVFSEPLLHTSVEAGDFAVGGRRPSSVDLQAGGRRVRLVFETPPAGRRVVVREVSDLTGNERARASAEIAFVAQPFEERPPGDLVINEILYDPLEDDFDDRPNQPEYVELYNPTDRPLALEGYFLTDRPDEEGEVNRIDLGGAQASVAPQGFAVAFAAGDASLAEAFPESSLSDSIVTLLPVERNTLSFRNEEGVVVLRRPDSTLIDSVFYRSEWQSQAVEGSDGRALERLDPRGPSNRAANWTTSTATSGGTPGRSNRAALPAGESSAEAGIEVVPSPFSPDGDGVDDVAFIRYALDAPVSLARLRIYDSKGREVFTREAELVGREGYIPWEGRSSAGNELRIGIYVVFFEALDAERAQVATFKAPVVLARFLH